MLHKYESDIMLSYNNIMAAWAVDREFDYILEPAVLSLVAFGSTLGSLWLAQAPLGAFGPSPDRRLGLMWVPLALPWAPLAILGLPGRFGLNLESTCKVKVAQVPRLRTKYRLKSIPRIPAGKTTRPQRKT